MTMTTMTMTIDDDDDGGGDDDDYAGGDDDDDDDAFATRCDCVLVSKKRAVVRYWPYCVFRLFFFGFPTTLPTRSLQ